jgi:hypothetical protein
MSAAHPPALPPELPPKQRQPRGCFFYAAITVAVLALVVGVAGFFVFRFALDRFGSALYQFSEEQPFALPESRMRNEEYQELVDRIQAWRAPQSAVPSLELTAEDVNALIARHPDWTTLRGKLYFDFKDRTVLAMISLPLVPFAGYFEDRPELAGRYINAEVALHAALDRGALQAELHSVILKDRELPEVWVDVLRKQRALHLVAEQHGSEWKEELESFRVEGGKLLLQRKSANR